MPTKVKGCRNCSRRRINCDRGHPRCRKCVRDNLECFGLEGSFRWVTPANARKTRRDARSRCTTSTSPPQDVVAPDTDTERSLTLVPSPMLNYHPEQWVMNYFAEELSHWMCPFRRPDNECKSYLLPFAMSSRLVSDAMAAASFHRLAYYGNPEFAIKAEKYKASVIKGLLGSADRVCSPGASPHDKLSAAAAVLILMYDDMIAAQDYFILLARISSNMLNFVDFSTLGSPELSEYLVEQLKLLTLFSIPHAENDTAVGLQTTAFEFLEKFATSSTTGHHKAALLAYYFRTTLTLWSEKKKDPSCDVSSTIEQLKISIESDEDFDAFEHYMTWVYFIAAVASATPDHRQFFVDRLRMQYVSYGWKNVGLMLQFVQELAGFGTNWPAHLQAHKQYLCA